MDNTIALQSENLIVSIHELTMDFSKEENSVGQEILDNLYENEIDSEIFLIDNTDILEKEPEFFVENGDLWQEG